MLLRSIRAPLSCSSPIWPCRRVTDYLILGFCMSAAVHSNSVSLLSVFMLESFGRWFVPGVDSRFIHIRNPTSVELWKIWACSARQFLTVVHQILSTVSFSLYQRAYLHLGFRQSVLFCFSLKINKSINQIWLKFYVEYPFLSFVF